MFHHAFATRGVVDQYLIVPNNNWNGFSHMSPMKAHSLVVGTSNFMNNFGRHNWIMIHLISYG